MGSVPRPSPTIRCPECGRENDVTRKDCWRCHQLLPAHSTVVPPTPGPVEPATSPVVPAMTEVETLRASLQAATLQVQLQQEELDKAHATIVGLTSNVQAAKDKAAPLEAHADVLKEVLTGNWESAETKVKGLGEELEAKVKAFKDLHLQAESAQKELRDAKGQLGEIAHLPGVVDELTGKVKDAEDKASGLAAHAEGLGSRLKEVEATVEELGGKLVAKTKEVEDAVANVLHLHGHVAKLSGDLKVSQDKAGGLEAHAANLMSQLGSTQAKIAELAPLPERVGQLTKSLQAAHGNVNNLISHAAGLEEKCTTANEKAADFEAKLAAANAKIAELIKNPVVKEVVEKANPKLKYIFGMITAVGSLGGFGAGRYVLPKETSAAQTTQAPPHGSQDKMIDDLNTKLKATTDKAAAAERQSQVDLDAANKKSSDLAAQLAQVRVQLAQKTAAGNQTQSQSAANIDAANSRVKELSATEQGLRKQLSDAQVERTKAYNTLAQRNAELAALQAQMAPRGTLFWSGNVVGKRTIQIKDGVPDYGSLSGALPQRECKVSTPQAHVKIKGRPSKNHWNSMSFEVTGSGDTQVRIDWEANG
jgi:chromosome segregation ATPase